VSFVKAKDIRVARLAIEEWHRADRIKACPVAWNEGFPPQTYFGVLAERLHQQYIEEHPEVKCECR
jgi:hypothetical protein